MRTKSSKASNWSNTSKWFYSSLLPSGWVSASASLGGGCRKEMVERERERQRGGQVMLLTASSSSTPCNLLFCFGEFLKKKKIAQPAPAATLFVLALLNEGFSIERELQQWESTYLRSDWRRRWTGFLGQTINPSHSNSTVFQRLVIAQNDRGCKEEGFACHSLQCIMGNFWPPRFPVSRRLGAAFQRWRETPERKWQLIGARWEAI